MTDPHQKSDDITEADKRLAKILDDITSRVAAGEVVDPDRCIDNHPEFADRLRNLLPTIEVLVDLDRTKSDPERTLSSADVPQQLGDFRLIQEIGRGGMGIVYEAEEISLQRRVALKVLPFASVLDKRQLHRFRNEARAVAGLHHPNIVPVYSVGCERGVHYYAMQQVHGQSLSELIASIKAANSKARVLAADHDTERNAAETLFDTSSRDWFHRVATIGKQVADALEYAHCVAIVHRDIKPSNLLLDESGKVWVADFGLAQVDSEAELTMTGELIGTLRYMSPEQLHGDIREVDSRTDVFSLGATLYELLTLCPVRRGSSRAALLASKVEEAASPGSVNPAIPVDLETIVLRTIAADPDQRYRTAGDLAQDLQRFLDHQPIHAKRPTIADRLSTWSRRNQRLLWAATTVFAIVAVISTTSAFLVGKARNKTEAALTETRRKSEALEIQTQIAESEKQNAQRSLARLLAQRGIDGTNSGEVKGLFDLAKACAEVADIPEQFRPMSQLWAIAKQHHAGRMIIADPQADVIAFSPDSRYIAMARDKDVWMYSLVTGKRIGPSQTNERPIGCLEFSPDGQRLVAHSAEGSGQLFSSPDMTRIGLPLRHEFAPVEFHGMMKFSAAFSPNGKTLITTGVCGTIRFWDASDGQAIGDAFTDAGVVTEVSFHPTENWFVTGGETTRVWDVSTREPVSPQLEHFEGISGGLARFSPNGQSVATLQGLWNIPNWNKQEGILSDTSVARDFSDDGRFLACARRDWTVRLWDVERQQQFGKLLQHPARVRAVDFSPDGQKLACASMDESVRLWNVKTQTPFHPQFALPGPVSRVHFSNNGQYVAACSLWGPARVWSTNVTPIAMRVPLAYSAECVRFSADGTQMAVGDTEGQIHILDFDELVTKRRPDQTKHRSAPWTGLRLLNAGRSAPIKTLAWSPDGSMIAAISNRNAIQLWNTVDGTHSSATIGSGNSILTSLDFHPDGKILAIGAQDWVARLFDLESKSVIQTVRCREQIHAIRFHENGKWIITGLQDGTLRVWDPETGERVGPMRKHQVPVRSLAACEDFWVSVSGSENDALIRFWPTNDDAYENGLKINYDAPVKSVNFVPGTQTLAILDKNGEVQLWEMPQPGLSAAALQQATIETLGAAQNADGTLSPM